MKTVIVTILLLISQACHAADAGFCRAYGYVYLAAAYARDLGNPPAIGLTFTEPYAAYVSEAMRKAIINQVYFAPGFANARGDVLRLQMTGECINGPRNWKAL
jgi:hypothetical protein